MQCTIVKQKQKRPLSLSEKCTSHTALTNIDLIWDETEINADKLCPLCWSEFNYFFDGNIEDYYGTYQRLNC